MMTVKTIGRRLFSRAAIGVPTALKLGAHPGLPPSTIGAGAGVAGVVGGNAYNPGDPKAAAMTQAWRAIRVEQKAEREFEDMRSMRRHMMGGLDPDLAVLNSMSLQRRVQIQMDREKAVRDRANTLSARILRRFGLDPEEFQ
jgi:hypothetical protein